MRYQAYRRLHATRLVRMTPREAIRPMYRKARVAGFENSEAEPLETLILFAETLIPLPPFEVWHQDLRTNPDAHLRDLNESAEAPTAAAPSTVEVRSMRYAGAPRWAQAQVVS